MNRQSRVATWVEATAGIVCVLLLTLQAHASDYSGKVTEEFHHTYPLTAGGRISLENINGPVHITAWDQNQVKVDAVKYASRKDRLDEARIEIDASSDYISIRTEYRDHNLTFNDHGWNNPASVEYSLTVPRSASLDEIELVNGELDIHGVTGEVRASCVNGRLGADGLQGRAELSTVNGRLEANFAQLGASRLELSSVNGTVEPTLPSDAKAELEGSTVSGGIENDFGLHVNNHHWIGHDMRGELGGGGTRIKLSNVNGRIAIHHANDGKAISSAKDLSRHDHDRDEDDDDDEI